MKKIKGILTLKVFILIIGTDVLESLAELFLKKGALTTKIDNVTFANMFEFASKIIPSYNLWIGILFYVMNFFLWIVVLSKIDLSLAFPVGSAAYIFVPMLALFFLGEKVTLIRWVGICLIILGIYFLSRSGMGKAQATHDR